MMHFQVRGCQEVWTHRDPEELSRSGVLAEDVLERIEEFVVRVPPLRERREDIPPLVRYLLRKLSARFGREILDLDAHAWDFVRSYDWPTNVRQLRNVLVQAAVDRPDSIIRFDAIQRAYIARGMERTEQAVVAMIAKPATTACDPGTNGCDGHTGHTSGTNGNGHASHGANGHISEEVWFKIELLVAEYDPGFARGLPREDRQRMVEHVIRRMTTGMPWRSFGAGNTWFTAYRAFKRWECSGLLDLIRRAVARDGCRRS